MFKKENREINFPFNYGNYGRLHLMSLGSCSFPQSSSHTEENKLSTTCRRHQRSEDFIPKKGKSKSVVWKWYGFAASDKEQTSPRCKVCLKAVAAKDSSTANLFQHLKKKHSHERDQCVALWASQNNDDESLKTPSPKHKHVTIEE